MRKNKLAFLMLLCLVCVLMTTACHKNNDPWPASGQPAVTAAPTDAPASVVAPQSVVEQPTAQPQDGGGDSVGGGFNG